MLLNGTLAKFKKANLLPSHSRMLFLQAYPCENLEMEFGAHDRAFAFSNCPCLRGICENVKAAVDTVLVGKERTSNRRFLQMTGIVWSNPSPAHQPSYQENGRVENQAPGTGVLLHHWPAADQV